MTELTKDSLAELIGELKSRSKPFDWPVLDALKSLALEALAMRRSTTVQWHDGKETPTVAKSYEKALTVAVRRGTSGKAYVFPACYLNAMPLVYPRECICENEADHDDGCPTSGWFTFVTSNGYDSGVYERLLSPGDELLAWAELPTFDETTLSAIPKVKP